MNKCNCCNSPYFTHCLCDWDQDIKTKWYSCKWYAWAVWVLVHLFPVKMYKVKGHFIAITWFPWTIGITKHFQELMYFEQVETINHERIHHAQMLEWVFVAIPLLFFVPWYWSLLALFGQPIFYGINLLIRVPRYTKVEREAYNNEHDAYYLKKRVPFLYLFK